MVGLDADQCQAQLDIEPCEANVQASLDSARYERAALRCLQRFVDERLPPLAEVALAASALAEVRHGDRTIGLETLKRLLRRG